MSNITGIENGAKRWALTLGIIILLNLVFNYGLSVFYPAPQWDDFCEEQQMPQVTTQASCEAISGAKWVSYTNKPVFEPEIERGPVQPEAEGYCDTTFECRQAYDEAREVHGRTAFFVLVLLGVASILGGIVISKSNVVGNSLTYGGVLALIIASMRYWASADDVVRLLIMVVALAILIGLALKKFKD